jgi:hypothetical protein
MPRLTLMGSLYPVYLVLVNGAIAALTLRAPRRSAHFAGGPRARLSGQSAGQHRAQPFSGRIPAPRMGPHGSRSRQILAISEDGAVPGTGGPLCVAPTSGIIGAPDAEEVVGTVPLPRLSRDLPSYGVLRPLGDVEIKRHTDP